MWVIFSNFDHLAAVDDVAGHGGQRVVQVSGRSTAMLRVLVCGCPIGTLDTRSPLPRFTFKSARDELPVLHGRRFPITKISVPATAAVQRDARDDYGRYQHYGNSHHHDASICDKPQARHSKVYSSGNPPNRVVLLASFMG